MTRGQGCELWEKQPDETGKAYDKFCRYRDMGSIRSLRKTAEQLGVSRQTLEELSVRHNWVARAQAYDLEVDRLSRIESEKAIQQMRKNHAKLAVQITAKAARGLLNIPDEALTPRDIARLVDVGVRIERLSRGEELEVKKSAAEPAQSRQAGPGGHNQGLDLSQLSDKELDDLEGLLKKLSAEPDI